MNWFNNRTVLNPNLTLNADFDVQLQIEDIITELDIKWTTQHVKDHQTGPDLSWEVQLNNKADDLATNARNSITQHYASIHTYQYPDVHIHLTINDQLITQKVGRELQEAYTTILLRNNMCKRFEWTNSIASTIEWNIHGHNLICLPFYKYCFVVKLIHERLSVQGE
eukprot:15365740-Ditylum_brightwellii.AAC.2